MSLSMPLIAAQVDSVLAHDAQARVIAIRAGTRGAWPDVLTRNGQSFELRWCESTLAAREAVEACTVGGHGLVLLTPLTESHLGHDLVGRLARARVFRPEGWEMARQLFRAREADARLARYDWMPQALVDAAGAQGYAPVGNGFLDLDTAWRTLLERWVQLPEARPDALLLLRWSMDTAALRLYAEIPAAARPAVAHWLAEAAGPLGRPVMQCVEAGQGLDAVPLGLVCGVVFVRISAIVDACFRLIVDGESAPSMTRWGSAQVLG